MIFLFISGSSFLEMPITDMLKPLEELTKCITNTLEKKMESALEC
jgi:hypothetical protein